MSCLGFLGAVQEKEGTSVIGTTEFLMVLGAISPALILWIAIIIFAVIVLRHGGGRAERFLIAGASLKVISNLLSLPSFAILHWLISEGYSVNYASSVVSGYGIFGKVVGMAGIICLVYAFWVKFKARNIEGEVPLPQH